MMEQRHHERAFTRRASQVDELEVSRRKHEDFRSSMFSSSNRALEPPLPPGLPSGAYVGYPGGGNAPRDGPPDVTNPGESIVDAAIRAALAKDSERGAHGFHRDPTSANTSTNSSTFIYQNGVGGVPPNSHKYPHHQQQPAVVGGGSGGTAQVIVPSPSTDRMPRERTIDPYRRHHYVGAGDVGTGGGSNGSNPNSVYVYDQQTQQPQHRRIGQTSSGSGSGASLESSGSGARGTPQAKPRSIWERGGGENNTRAVARTYNPQPAVTEVVPMESESIGISGSTGGSGRGPRPESGSQTGSSSSASGGVARSEVPRENVQHQSLHAWDDDVSDLDVDDRGVGHGGVALTPTGDDEPLELPDGCQHISLSHFLEVMTGPGLRVRKHHRAGKGSSGLRVLRYSEDDDSLVWDSHKILGAAQHVLPLSDVEGVSMQPGNRVVLTCVGGKDSYAVFEAAKDDTAAVLFVGLERLRERSATRSSA